MEPLTDNYEASTNVRRVVVVVLIVTKKLSTVLFHLAKLEFLNSQDFSVNSFNFYCTKDAVEIRCSSLTMCDALTVMPVASPPSVSLPAWILFPSNAHVRRTLTAVRGTAALSTY